jgi:sugar transferase (PEP-CTERM/EpsH1 system associated)
MTGATNDTQPLIVHIVFRFDYGGLENGLVNLINGASGKFRHAIIALTESTEFSKRLRDPIPIYELHKRPGKDPKTYLRLFRLLRKLRPAAVHTRNLGTLDCAVIAAFAGVPVRIHGEHGWDIFDPDGTNPKYRLMRRFAGRFVRRFVTVSQDLKRWLVNVVGISADKITSICNGVDVERFRPRTAGDVSPLPADVFGAGAVVVGSVTRFEPIKDPLNLIEAFIRVRARADAAARSVRLLMVGDGELRNRALARLAEAGAADAAWLPGSRADVAPLLRCMDVFVLGSLREGISNTVLEAMASGVPVIATATGGNPELVADGDTGRLVPPGDAEALAAAIDHYVRDRDARAEAGRRARLRALEKFSLGVMLHNYEDLYDRALATVEA